MRKETIDKVNVYLCDCMDFMRDLPDNYYNLAIVDPPYGINDLKKNKKRRHISETSYKNKKTPTKEYFNELKRVSSRQIIWGCQYMVEFLNKEGSFIIWDKKADPNIHHMSSCDVAWYSKRKRIHIFHGAWCGAVKIDKEKTIHPHQKPVKLYEWLLTNYAEKGDKILDTHFGSGSHGVACNNLGFELDAIELDKDYYNASVQRLKDEVKQMRLVI